MRSNDSFYFFYYFVLPSSFTEREMQGLQNLLTSLDTSVLELKESVEGMRPAYNQALQLLASSNLAPPGQKNNLVRPAGWIKNKRSRCHGWLMMTPIPIFFCKRQGSFSLC